MSIYSNAWMHAKVYEPRKRNKDGMRWIAHRFPIKNGISYKDTLWFDLANQKNPLLDLFLAGKLKGLSE